MPWAISATALSQTHPLDTWPAAARDIFNAAVRQCDADGSGNFEFTDLPPGEYQLETKIEWKVPGVNGLDTTGGRVTRKVTIRGTETTRVMLTR